MNIFLFRPEKHVLGSHFKSLIVALLINTHNICFYE